MGTSQSLHLKTTPQWSSAKKAVTSVINDPENQEKCQNFMTKFVTAIGNDGIYYGSDHHGRNGDVRHAFGRAGAKYLGNVLDFVSNIKSHDLPYALDILNIKNSELLKTPEDLINILCGLSAANTNAQIDEESATIAQRRLLAEMFKECDDLESVEEMIKAANEDTLDSWIIFYEVEYIIEFQGTLFQTHILDKDANPDNVFAQIKRWLKIELNSRLTDEIKHIDLFSEEGKQYIDKLTSKILLIWQ